MIDVLLLMTSALPSSGQAGVDARQDIVVTGERIARTPYETATSVAVETAASLEVQAHPDRIEQLLQATPNVQLGSGGEGPAIRGQDATGVVRDLPAFLSGVRPRMTLNIDGRPATYYELAFGLTSLWDVGRVEIFRSPQTTTQGRNAIGGAIFVETNEPAADWTGRARLLAGNYATRQASGVISGPLAENQLFFRLSGDVRRSHTASRMTSMARGIDPNRDDSDQIRLKLQAQPKGLPDTRLSLTYAHGRSNMPQIEGIRAPFAARRDPAATYGIFAIRVDSLTGRVAYRPAGGFEGQATISYGRADVRRHAPPGLGEAAIEARDFSIEPVLGWRSAEGLRLTGGLHYTHARLDQSINLAAFPLVQGSGAFADAQDSLGLFGEGELPLTQALTLTAGLRYQYDRQVRRGMLAGPVLRLPLDYDRHFTDWLPKVALAWDITPDLRIGALAQRASNPGGVNLNAASARAEHFGAESLWNFELFARARLDRGRLTLSANMFRYEMADAQRTTAIPVVLPGGQVTTIAQVDNAPRAWTMGGEVELDWRPAPQWQLRGAIGLLDTKITRTRAPADRMRGKQFQRSPHFSGSASLSWRPAQPWLLSAHVRRHSSYFSDDLETAARRVDAATIVDAKAAWTWRGTTLSFYVRNLFDAFHLTYRFDAIANLATAADPREVGLGIEARF